MKWTKKNLSANFGSRCEQPTTATKIRSWETPTRFESLGRCSGFPSSGKSWRCLPDRVRSSIWSVGGVATELMTSQNLPPTSELSGLRLKSPPTPLRSCRSCFSDSKIWLLCDDSGKETSPSCVASRQFGQVCPKPRTSPQHFQIRAFQKSAKVVSSLASSCLPEENLAERQSCQACTCPRWSCRSRGSRWWREASTTSCDVGCATPWRTAWPEVKPSWRTTAARKSSVCSGRRIFGIPVQQPSVLSTRCNAPRVGGNRAKDLGWGNWGFFEGKGVWEKRNQGRLIKDGLPQCESFCIKLRTWIFTRARKEVQGKRTLAYASRLF